MATNRVIVPEVVLLQLSSWRWAQSCSKHVEDSNKHIIGENVRQVDHLPELYEDAWSEKYKMLLFVVPLTVFIPTKKEKFSKSFLCLWAISINS